MSLDYRNTNLSGVNLINANLTGAQMDANTTIGITTVFYDVRTKTGAVYTTGIDFMNTTIKYEGTNGTVNLSNTSSTFIASYIDADGSTQTATMKIFINTILKRLFIFHAFGDYTSGFVNTVNLTNMNLTGAILNSTNLKSSSLNGANLTQTIMTNTNLWGVNMTNANLTGATLRSEMAYTNLSGANLTDTNLEGCVFFTNTKISESTVFYDMRTKQGVKYKVGSILKSGNTSIAYLTGQTTQQLNNATPFFMGSYIDTQGNVQTTQMRMYVHVIGTTTRFWILHAYGNYETANMRGVHFGGVNLSGANLKDTQMNTTTVIGQNTVMYDLRAAAGTVYGTGVVLVDSAVGVQYDDGANPRTLTSSNPTFDASYIDIDGVTRTTTMFMHKAGTKLYFVHAHGGYAAADLRGADLSESNLVGAVFDGAQMNTSTYFGANTVMYDLRLKRGASYGGGVLLESGSTGVQHRNGAVTTAITASVPVFVVSYIDANGTLQSTSVAARITGNTFFVLHAYGGYASMNLSGAILTGANLTGADLSGANLQSANLHGTILNDVNLAGAVLTDSVMNFQTSINENTILYDERVNVGARYGSGIVLASGSAGVAYTSQGVTRALTNSAPAFSASYIDAAGVVQTRTMHVRLNSNKCFLLHAHGEYPSIVLSGASLVGAYLRGVNLSDADMAGVDVSGGILSGANLSDAGLVGANMQGVELNLANLSDADMTGTQLQGAVLVGANLSGANIENAVVNNTTTLSRSTVFFDEQANKGVVYGGGVVLADGATGVQYAESTGTITLSNDNREFMGSYIDAQGVLQNTKMFLFTSTNRMSVLHAFGGYTQLNVSGSLLSGAYLRGAGLVYADMSGAIMDGADLREATMTNAGMTGAIMTDANMSGANMTDASLIGTSLLRANLSGAVLTRVSFLSADVRDANLQNANLREANLTSAILCGANMSGAHVNATTRFSTSTMLYDARTQKGVVYGTGLVLVDGATGILQGTTQLTNGDRFNGMYFGMDGFPSIKSMAVCVSGGKLFLMHACGGYAYADLSNVDMSDLDMTCANMTFAKLSGAQIVHTNLSGANINDAIMSEDTVFVPIMYDFITRQMTTMTNGIQLETTQIRALVNVNEPPELVGHNMYANVLFVPPVSQTPNVVLQTNIGTMGVFKVRLRVELPTRRTIGQGVRLYINFGVPCYASGTKILCRVGDEDVYVCVEDLREKMLVKTSRGKYVPIKYIGTRDVVNVAGADKKNVLYVLHKRDFPDLTEDLRITGQHAVWVDQLVGREAVRMVRGGDTCEKVNGRHRLMAMYSEKAEMCPDGVYTVYHIVLSSSTPRMTFTVYANGILSETLPESTFLKHMYRNTSKTCS